MWHVVFNASSLFPAGLKKKLAPAFFAIGTPVADTSTSWVSSFQGLEH